jgi:hypothetical protein
MLRNAAGKGFQGMKRIQKGRNLPINVKYAQKVSSV